MLTAKQMAKTQRAASGCLFWRGALGNGYPVAKHEGRAVYIKRVEWEEAHGSVPDGAIVTSSCGERTCIEPTHLMLARPGRIGGRRDLRGKYARDS